MCVRAHMHACVHVCVIIKNHLLYAQINEQETEVLFNKNKTMAHLQTTYAL